MKHMRYQSFSDAIKKNTLWNDQCLEWVGHLVNGYGKFKFNGVHHYAHRIAFSLYYGEIPKDKIVCHKCNNRKCCNPIHLYAGTHHSNALDKVRAGRSTKGKSYNTTRSGHKNNLCKLAGYEVEMIRKFHKSKTLDSKSLSIFFDVHQTTINHLLSRRTWKHI